MRTTPLKLRRKSSLKLKPWSPDYLASSTLQVSLNKLCERLEGQVLDLGCGNRPYESLLTNATAYVGYDIDIAGSKPDIVGVSAALPFQSASFDSILCTQVLEHVEEPWSTIEEIARVLKPQGVLLLSAPQSWRLHEKPHDFYRYTRYGLLYLLQRSGLRIISIEPQGGVWVLVGQIINNTIWHNAPQARTVSWLFRIMLSCFINISCVLANRFNQDVDDTYNYVVFAQKL